MKSTREGSLAFGVLAVAATLTSACGGELEPGAALEADTSASPIDGGRRVRAGEFEFVTTIRQGGWRCTGTKIASRRFLTAAHCVDDGRLQPGDNLRVTKDLDGISRRPDLTVAAVHIHPSWEIAPVVLGDRRYLHQVYDIAVVDVEELTSDIPTAPIGRGFIGDGSDQVRAVGYGIDDTNGTDDGWKQYADFWVTYWSYWRDNSDLHRDYARGQWVHNVVGWTDDQDDVNSGDSGGPFLLYRNSRWEVVGVIAGLENNGPRADFNYAARTGNVYRWIQSPAKNQFYNYSGGFLLNAKSVMCADVVGESTAIGAELGQYACDGSDETQASQYMQLRSAGGGKYLLRNGKSGLCLSGRSSGFGDGVALFPCDANDSLQRWDFESNGNEVYAVRNVGRSGCLQAQGQTTAMGARLVIGSCAESGSDASTSWVFHR